MVINYLRTQRAPVVCREAPDNVLLDLLVLQRHFVILGAAVPDAERPPVDHRGL